MKRIDSAVFRAGFKSLTEPVLVTRYGKVIGTYLPGNLEEGGVTQVSSPSSVLLSVEIEPAPSAAPVSVLTENAPAQPEPDKRRQAQAALIPSSYSAFRPVPKPTKKR